MENNKLNFLERGALYPKALLSCNLFQLITNVIFMKDRRNKNCYDIKLTV